VSDSFGDHETAAQYHLLAIAIREKTLGKDHIQLSTSYLNLGITYSLMSKHQDSINAIARGLTINLQVHGPNHPSVLQCYEWMVQVYRSWGKEYEAVQFGEKAKEVERELKKLGISDVGERIVD